MLRRSFWLIPYVGQYDSLEYVIYSLGGAQCRNAVRDALFEMDRLIVNGEGEYLQERLKLCQPVDTSSTLDIAALYEHYILFITDYINRQQ